MFLPGCVLFFLAGNVKQTILRLRSNCVLKVVGSVYFCCFFSLTYIATQAKMGTTHLHVMMVSGLFCTH